jgi:hypothetical protein
MFEGWSMNKDVSQEKVPGLKRSFISVGKWIQTLPILKIGILWCFKYFEQISNGIQIRHFLNHWKILEV